jgi:glycosyltransferase involved in cell wall biosynthesis
MDSSNRPLELSLVIPAYNEEKYIGACIEEALKHDGFKEIIVVDNASTDRTADIARGYARVKVVSEPRRGTGFARDTGFLNASGDIIAFVDADTKIRKGWSDRIVSAFVRDENLACITGPYWFYDLPPSIATLIWLNWHLAYIGNMFTGPLAVGGNMALRRTVLEKMNGFDTSIIFYGDDIDVTRRASRFGRVIFTFSIMIDSSGRRYKKFGVYKTLGLYMRNGFVGAFMSKPRYTSDYEEVR